MHAQSVRPAQNIPFNRPCLVGTEEAYVREAIARGHISGDGLFTAKCHQLLSEWLGGATVLLTTSCTHALEMCALLLRIEPGDEVIMPSFTFVSTANAFVLAGAKPVFVDIRRDTLNLDESRVAERISPRTKAVVAVHYAGVACDMGGLNAALGGRDIALVEDNAHGLRGSYKAQPLGTFGKLATLSFHETKNFSCGEGGALIVNDPELLERAEIIREKGTNRKRFFRGQVDKYSWVDVGSSYLPSDILAAYLFAQLEAAERIQSARKSIWYRYRDALSSWAAAQNVTLPHIPGDCDQSYHMFYLLLPEPRARDRFIADLKESGILSVFHYLPLHLSEMGMRLGGRAGDCPVTEDISDRLVRLPFFNDLSERDQERVISHVLRFRC